MHRPVSRRSAIAILTSVLVPATAVAADVTVIQGSTTFNTRLFVPYGSDIEAAASVKLEVIPTKSAYGLVALIEQRASLAMISGPLERELPQLRARLPKAPIEQLYTFEIARTGVAFVAHPDNPVKQLTIHQIISMLDGRITSWREVNGPDLPIKPTFVKNGGVINTIEAELLAGNPIQAPQAVPVESPRHVLKVVLQEPGAIAIAQSALASQMALIPITTDREITQVLNIVSLGQPTATQRRLIDVMRATAARNLR
jgi:phosphate transport system substrate-binding protein